MTETYINFDGLIGDELNNSFREWCIKKGFNDSKPISVVQVPCITGHQSFIVSQAED